MISKPNPLTRLAGLLSLCLMLSLQACAGLPPVQAPPQVVTVTEVRYVEIPAADMLPCPQPAETATPTNADLLTHDRGETKAATCDEQQLAKVRDKSGQVVKSPAAATAPSTPATQPR